ncbi:MAG: hypothetical protein QOI31_3122 [Solirubrobacterales bacterium]|nr:hypothetical protein [Solirubrobacterales bacterium]
MAPRNEDKGELGPRVRAARERLGWSREALAFHSDLSWSAIAQVETGRRTNLRPSTLTALSNALGVTVDYLLTGSLTQTPMLEHSAFLYSADDQFQATMGSFLAEGLERGEPTLAMTTSGNIELLRAELGKDAQDVKFVVSSDWLTSPANALGEFSSFAVSKIGGGAPWARFIAQPIWEGRSDSEVRLWTRFESLFNLLFATAPLTVVCPYDERSVPSEVVRDAHRTHPHIMGRDALTESPDYRGPGRIALDL